MTVIAKHEVQAALRGALGAISGIPDAAHTEWENRPYTPTVGVPWMRERLGLVESRRASHGDGFNADTYAYMLDLMYPSGRDVLIPSQAEQALRSAFFFGATLLVRAPYYLEITSLRVGPAQDHLPNWYFPPVVIGLLIYGPPK